jgi:hypothetical protein
MNRTWIGRLQWLWYLLAVALAASGWLVFKELG